MAIPDKQQPFPQRIRPVYNRKDGVHVPTTMSIQTVAVQGTPNDPARQAQHIASGTGSRTIILTPPNPIVVDVPLQGISAPFTTSSVLSLVADAPIITLPEGAPLGSVSVQPMVILANSATAIGAATIGRGLKIGRFLVRVTFRVANFSQVGQPVTVSASARLVTAS